MSNDDRINRLSELAKIHPLAGIDHRNVINSPLVKKPSRKERRKGNKFIKKITNKYRTILRDHLISGTYPNDIVLRYFAREYTHRYASSGLYNQPVSFNYIEPFCRVKLFAEAAPYVDLLEEVNSVFNASDFFDFITSDDAKEFKFSSLLELPEDKVFHYTINGDITDLSFLNCDSREFIIAGFSFVRRGKSLHWYLLGGEVYRDVEWQKIVEKNPKHEAPQIDPLKRAFLKETDAFKEGRGKPLAIEGHKTAHKTLVAGEISLVTQKYYSRCIMREYENIFELTADDPDVFYTLSDEDARVHTQGMEEKINRASVMWDLVGSLFQLPFYFECRIGLPKKLVKLAGNKVKPLRNKGGKGIQGTFEKVPSHTVINTEVPLITKVALTHYQPETKGYWRKLKPGQMGKDPDGEEEPNRTWIKVEKDIPQAKRIPKTIYVKSTIKSSKLKLEEYLKVSTAE